MGDIESLITDFYPAVKAVKFQDLNALRISFVASFTQWPAMFLVNTKKLLNKFKTTL